MPKTKKDLVVATRNGNLPAVRECLNAGIDINTPFSDDWRALHWAAYCNQLEIAQYLVEHGADINLPSTSGRTALDLAREYKRSNILVFLETAAASQNIPEWSRFGATSVAHVEFSFPLGRQITHIFNLGSRQYHAISENLKTHVESITPHASFDELPGEMLEKIFGKFTELGGVADKSFILHGTRQLKKNPPGGPCP